jgi:hypothetical protein
MDVSPAVYAEIKERLEACGQNRVIQVNNPTGGTFETLSLNDIAIKAETDERIKVWIIFNGKRINKKAQKRGKMLPPEGTSA